MYLSAISPYFINSILGQSRTPVPTNIERANSSLFKFVSTFKRFCNKEYGKNIWQSRFYDHIIRDAKDRNEIANYIEDNITRWELHM